MYTDKTLAPIEPPQTRRTVLPEPPSPRYLRRTQQAAQQRAMRLECEEAQRQKNAAMKLIPFRGVAPSRTLTGVPVVGPAVRAIEDSARSYAYNKEMQQRWATYEFWKRRYDSLGCDEVLRSMLLLPEQDEVQEGPEGLDM